MAVVRPWHASETAEVVDRLATDSRAGLSSGAIGALRARHGLNALPAAPQRSTWVVFLAQFKSPLIYLLFGAAAIALALGERNDAIVIFTVVLVNAIVGAFQEGRAEQALAALRRLSAQKANVVRDGHEQQIDARDLVPGDVLVLGAGDAVTADARVVAGAALQIAEAALTGESVPVAKAQAPVAAEAVLADRTSMVYAGTHVTAGRARAVVVETGAATEIGRIAALAEGHAPQQTPLERRVERFGHYLMVLAAVIFAAFFAIGLVARVPLAEIAMVGISQVVGLIPEGLPVAMTVALAVGVQRMAKRRAIVRRLSAVETLGSTTVICSDKTGTLTRNEMTVTDLWVADGATEASLVEAAVLCNDARGDIGDPTELALLRLAIERGLVPDAIRAARPRCAEIPFDPATKLMATQHGSTVMLKGAAEAILPLCAGVDRAAVLARVDAMSARALRVLAFAEVTGAEIRGDAGASAFAGRARLLGLAGQIDPPRPEAAAAVARCQTAGIRPVMVTGDHKATGLAVARELGIAGDGDLALDGVELDALTDEALAATIDRVRVFARVHPAQKLRIVEAYQRRGEVVAMTGDGVNDAPALVRADVGVAMGITGTDVAKEAAKIVITDDNFGSIVAAVEEGRVVYRNIKKAVLLLMSTAFAEVCVLLLAIVLGYPPPFAAVMILWNNLVTEGVITVNLVLDPPQGDEMRRPPVPAAEPLITRDMWARIALMTPTITAVTLGWFIVRLRAGVPFAMVRTEAFTLLAVCEWFNVLNCMSERTSALRFGVLRDRWLVGGLAIGNLLQLAVIYIPAMNATFHTVPIPLREALAIGAAASLVLWVEELRKVLVRRKTGRVRTAR